MFTDPPHTAKSLAERLARYGFWARKELNVDVVKNALRGAKLVAQQPTVTHVMPHMPSVMHKEDKKSILQRMYSHPPVLRVLNDAWPILFMMSPRPTLSASIRVLSEYKKLGFEIDPQTLHAICRTELGRRNYLGCLDLLHLVSSSKLSSKLTVPTVLTSIGAVSSALWLESVPVSIMLATLWTGLSWTCLYPTVMPRVEWRANVPFYKSAVNHDKLVLANRIVTGIEELGSTNIANFHMAGSNLNFASDPSSVNETKLDEVLKSHGIQRRCMKESELYADYWSNNHKRWSQVEWHEPDQDPAFYKPKA